MTAGFGARLATAVLGKRTPLLVGIDPQASELPAELFPPGGRSLVAVAQAYETFGGRVIEQVADLVPAVKFQLAFFEALGVPGWQALDRLAHKASEAGLIVIFDGKRNDIGNTAAAYAEAYLGAANGVRAWPADALTVNPYLGAEGLEPFIKACREHGTGIFVLVRTSNPGAASVQHSRASGGTVSETIADWVEAAAASSVDGDGRYGAAGAVTGATAPGEIAGYRARMPHAWLLLPGYGAQGGTAADCAEAFDADGLGAIVNSSRGILFAYKQPRFAGMKWEQAVREATLAAIADLAAHTPAGALRKS
ncbi:MAG TPA: orotidine-5'-phosphate decarboxylase [Planctomycetia bacterium]|nr:orotidine-5'-phosphate decarboxylase [Planctomycetia bacterium]